jgi:hypothetical protein
MDPQVSTYRSITAQRTRETKARKTAVLQAINEAVAQLPPADIPVVWVGASESASLRNIKLTIFISHADLTIFDTIWKTVRGVRAGTFTVPTGTVRQEVQKAVDRHDLVSFKPAILPTSAVVKRPAPVLITSSVVKRQHKPDSPPPLSSSSSYFAQTPTSSSSFSFSSSSSFSSSVAAAAAATASSSSSSVAQPAAPVCTVCLCEESELSSPGGLHPLIIDVDADSPARCTHLICEGCRNRQIEIFLANPRFAVLECVQCRKARVPLKRRHLNMTLGQYLVDPATFAMSLDTSERAQLASKQKYFEAVKTVVLLCTFNPAVIPALKPSARLGNGHCPLCDSCTDGPLTAECQNLVRCNNLGCLVVSCAHCGEVNNHPPEQCKHLARLNALRAEFDPHNGRACPWPGCTIQGIQHYRDDGCHILQCPCGKCFCFVCGAIKTGEKHDVFTGRNCSCHIYCDSRCPCVPDPDKPARLPRRPSPPPISDDDDDDEEFAILPIRRLNFSSVGTDTAPATTTTATAAQERRLPLVISSDSSSDISESETLHDNK